MAKALIGYLPGDRRTLSPLAADNARLRARVADLEKLVVTLSEENDRLVADRAALLLEDTLQQMQPA
jgi:hypothetical protein